MVSYKNKFIIGLIITALGTVVMLFSMISIILMSSSYLYENIQSFPLSLNSIKTTQQTQVFNLPQSGQFSVWIKFPDRQIENRNILIQGALKTQEDQTYMTFKEDFRLGYHRNSSGKNQYYRIGSFHIEDAFNGYLVYSHEGSWRPPYSGFLVIRKIKGGIFSLKHFVFFILGLYVLLIGIKTINKNYGFMKGSCIPTF